MHSLIIAFVSF